jgi:hypothetical protein
MERRKRMDKALWNSGHEGAAPTPAKRLDWRRKISDHVAFALLGYTGLQIYVTMGAIDGGESILPYFALVLLVAAIIPGARMFEKRWEGLSDAEAADPELAPQYKRDRFKIWAAAIVLPFVVTGVIRGLEFLL